jgi:hypothetical protein
MSKRLKTQKYPNPQAAEADDLIAEKVMEATQW